MKYKAKLGGVTQYDRDDFINAKAVFPISIGNICQEDEKLKASIQLISKKFQSCDIIIADTLQRFNYLNSYPCSEAFKLAESDGDEWLKKNAANLKEMSIPYKIIRWEECKQDKSFGIQLNKIINFYNINEEYRKSFEQDIQIYLLRHVNDKIDSESAITKLKQNSLNYFFEEIAVLLSFFVTNAYNFILYPSNSPSSVAFSLKEFLLTSNPHLFHFLKIYFREKH